MITDVLSKHAKGQKERADRRAEIETEVAAKQVAREAAMDTTRISLRKGVAVTRDIDADQEKQELEAAAKAPLDNLRKVIDTTEEEIASAPSV